MDTRQPGDQGGPGGPRRTAHHSARQQRGGRRLLLGLALAAALAPLAGLSAGTAHAAGGQSYVVTTTSDPASCPDASGLSLRCAVALAQADGGQDTISFNLPTPSTISLASTLAITEPSGGTLTIQGPGAAALTLDGQHQVQDLAVAGTVTLANLTVANGLALGQNGFTGNGGGGGGGAAGLGGALIVNGGTVTVAGVAFTGNQAQGGSGGAGKNGAISGGTGGGPGGGAGGAAADFGGTGGPGGFASGGGGGGGLNVGSDSGGTGGTGGFAGGGGGGAEGANGDGGGGGSGGGFLPDFSTIGGYGGFGGGYGDNGGSGNGGGGGGAGLGGAIFVAGGALSVTGSAFKGNSAAGGAGGAGATRQVPSSAGRGIGGAIYAYQGTVTVDGCTTFGDSADDHAVYQDDQRVYHAVYQDDQRVYHATYTTVPCATTTQLFSAANPSSYGQAVTLNAQVATGVPGITPTGTITFDDGTTTLGTATLDGTGTASLIISSLNAGAHTITAVYGGDSSDTGSTSAALNEQVHPAPLTITASSPSVVYNGSVPAITPSYSGFVNGDSAASLSTAPTCASTAPSSGAAGTYPTSCTGAVDPNYTISYQPGTLTIGPATLTITANDQSMTYGGSVPAFDATYSGFVNGDTAASLTTAPTCSSVAASSDVGSYPITCAGAVDPNYTISYQSGTLTIGPAPLTISANDQRMTYGGTVPTFDASYGGLVNGDTGSVVSGLTCGAMDGSGQPVSSGTPAGAYAITCAGGRAANYTLRYQSGTLTINPAAQSISFGPLPNHTLGDAPLTVSATGGAAGSPLTFTAGPASVCTAGGANGATITLVGVGTCTVTADQAGDQNYLPAPSVAQSFTVRAAPLTLALGLSSSPTGPVTTGSTVTASLSVANHTTASQTVNLKVTLAYTGSHGYLSLTVPLTLKLSAGQTLSQSVGFKVQPWFPRGTYTLSATATDKGGDSASSAATLTVS